MINRLKAGLFTTRDSLTEDDYHRGARGLMIDGACATGMATLQGGPFLAAFALLLGASNYQIGLLATIVFASQLMQVPGLALVQKFKGRRGLVTLSVGLARLLWAPILLIPFVLHRGGIGVLMAMLVLTSMLGALAGPAWNSLIRDIVPADRMGKVFSRRMLVGTVVAMVLTLAGGYFIDLWKTHFPEQPAVGYSILFGVGLALGLVATAAVSRLPEPAMPTGDHVPLKELLLKPLRDRNFRRLIHYIMVWSFAVNLAGPFFIVYLLQRLDVPLKTVTLLVVTGQVANILFLRIWGKLADRFSNKSVLAASAPLFLLAIFAWTFTTMPERHGMTVPLLFAIHVLTGMSVAGVSLGTANIALKLSPEGQAHSYMTAYGIAAALAAAVAPVLGGVFADVFATRELSILLHWSGPQHTFDLPAMNLKALDFLFLMATVIGFFSLRLLRKVSEEGTVEEKKVREELVNETFAAFRVISTVPGLRYLVGGPVSAVFKLSGALKGRLNGSKNTSEPSPQPQDEPPGDERR